MERQRKALINGVLGTHRAQGVIEAVSPTGRGVVAQLPAASAEDLGPAVAAAREAFESGIWRRMSARDRGRRMRRLAELIDANRAELAELEALDTGKAKSYTAANDIEIAIEALDYLADQTRRISGHVSVLAPDHIHHTLVQPVGVVAELLPWNGPIWTGVQRLAAILAAGCSTVMKPSELGSLTFSRIAELVVEADIPAGVVNIVYGAGDIGEQLVCHPGVDAVSFTGGTATGGRILTALARSIKPVTLELGGKNALIVLADADVEAAAAWAVIGGFANAGQVCVSSSRLLVADAVHDRFVEAVVRHASQIEVGDPLDDATTMGTLISIEHAQKVWHAIDHARERGHIVLGGERYVDFRDSGAYVPPTVVTELPAGDPLLQTEIFGPVVTVERFRTESEAVHLANATDYGLSAGVFGSDARRLWEVAAALRAGEVYVNRWFSPGVLEAPVSGHKQSGLGPSGIDAYLRRTSVFFDRGDDLQASAPRA